METKQVTIGNVIVFGANLLHIKVLELIAFALKSEPYNDLQAIFVSKTGPKGYFGEYSKHTKSFVISIPRVLESAMEMAQSGNGISMLTACWSNIIYTIWHELHHNVAIAVAEVENLYLGDKWEEIEEETADEYANEKLGESIFELKMELPNSSDFPIFGGRVTEILEQNKGTNWEREQTFMINNHIVWQDKNTQFTSLVEFYQKAMGFTEKVERENPGALMDFSAVPNLYDQQTLPGERRESKAICVSVPGGVDVVQQPAVAQVAQKGEEESMEHYYADEDAVEDDNLDVNYGTDDDNVPWEEDVPFQAACAPAVAVQPQVAPAAVAPVFAAAAVPVQHDVATVIAMLRGVYTRLVEHAHAVTGFNNGVYTNPNGIFTPMQLTDHEKSFGVIVGSKTMCGKDLGYSDVKATGKVGGFIFSQSKVPGYEILINFGGNFRTYRVVCQNPNTNSPYALKCKAGARIG